ncbi:hypothetical protein JOQ06_003271 [Pogonophryne albipinna]|uniref:Uncharacterized protein n=1 Tax=Pogonophryne albipinna TaxID=1090488 RepID=A0AAD6B5Y8_9TELE|nr:hypothetical protein JOQ06_003271 [Pogonophryne albipinna]
MAECAERHRGSWRGRWPPGAPPAALSLCLTKPSPPHQDCPQAQGQTFSFPDVFPEKDKTPEEGSMEEMEQKFMEDEKQRQKLDPRRGGVTEWFGL